jgi:hypothetical protein
VVYSLNRETVSLVAVTSHVGPGVVSFGMDCREVEGGVIYPFPQIAAVALSAS